MTDEELLNKLSEGMTLKRSSIYSNWFGVMGSLRHTGDKRQIMRLVQAGKLRYTGPRQLEVKINENDNRNL